MLFKIPYKPMALMTPLLSLVPHVINFHSYLIFIHKFSYLSSKQRKTKPLPSTLSSYKGAKLWCMPVFS